MDPQTHSYIQPDPAKIKNITYSNTFAGLEQWHKWRWMTRQHFFQLYKTAVHH